MIGEGQYDVAQVCTNGHSINSASRGMPQFNQEFCDECGAPSITECPSCKTPIRGHYNSGSLSFSKYVPPAFCYKCGKPFPWTAAAISTAKELAELQDNLTSAEKQELAGTVDDLVRNTPRTPVAQARFRSLMKKVGKDGYEALRSVLTNVLSEAARKAIFGT